MNRHLLSLPLLLAALCAVGLSSCINWVSVNLHSYPDSVGKMVYVPCTMESQVDIYEYKGRRYARLPYYKVPAQGALLSYCYTFKHREVIRVPAADIPPYQPGMKLYHLYVIMDGMGDCPKNDRVLTAATFEGRQPIASCAGFLINRPYGVGFAPERSMANYAMMPITASLWVADAGLSVAATAGAYVLYNLPTGISVLLSCF